MAQTRISQDNPATLAKRLAEMPASQIAQEMEQALGTMTPETYDAAIIDAYLDELDRKAPMPEFPEEKTAWDAFTGDASCPKPANAEEPTSLRPLEHKRKWAPHPIRCRSTDCLYAYDPGCGPGGGRRFDPDHHLLDRRDAESVRSRR